MQVRRQVKNSYNVKQTRDKEPKKKRQLSTSQKVSEITTDETNTARVNTQDEQFLGARSSTMFRLNHWLGWSGGDDATCLE